MRAYLERNCDPNAPLVLGGDFNVAPDERDVHDPAAWEDTVLFHPEVREAYERILDWGLEDSFRILHQEPGTYFGSTSFSPPPRSASGWWNPSWTARSGRASNLRTTLRSSSDWSEIPGTG